MLQIQQNISLKQYNTFGVEAIAAQFIEISTEADLRKLFDTESFQQKPLLILGGGSNVLFTKNFDGLVIRINIKGIESKVTKKNIIVSAGAGEVWNDLVGYCVANNYAGLENLTLIPGTVGASPVQNIGAYGVELKDVFLRCKAFEISTGEIKTFGYEDCRFDYRESIFKNELKGKYIITSVDFTLSIDAKPNTAYGAIESELAQRGIKTPSIADVSAAVARIRVSKLPDPSTIGNAGSFFKNPIIDSKAYLSILEKHPNIVAYPMLDGGIKLAAGWLIEQCGFKGKIVGNTGSWKNQALVLVNHGCATGLEIYDYSQQIIDSVQSIFNITLGREVNIL